MELRSCYFCGSTGRTLETRELVPRPAADSDAADPSPAGVVLCPDCDAKLDRVLAHVLDTGRVRSGTAVAPPATGETTDAAAATGVDVSTEITFGEGEAGPDGGGGAPGPDRGDADGDPPAGTDDADREDGATDADGAGIDVVPGPTATGTTDDAAEGDEGEAATDEEAAEGDEGETDGEEDEAVTPPDGDAEDDAGGRSGGELRSLGESSAGTYRKALRLLQNREFPMERSDLVDVLSSAYDLDYGECERLVDFAVERGWLVEDGDELRRG